MSDKAKVRRLRSDLNRVRERSKGGGEDWKATVNMYESAERRKRAEDKMIHNSLGEADIRRSGIIANIQGLWRAKDDFNWRMEDIEVRGDKRVILVTSDIYGSIRQGMAGRRS